jgi:hypothetical protein
MILKLNY